MTRAKRHSRTYQLISFVTIISLVSTFYMPGIVIADQEATGESGSVVPRAPGPNAGGTPEQSTKNTGNQHPDQSMSLNVKSERRLSHRETEQNWNQYLKDPRWRALEKEARQRGYKRAQGEKRLWGYEADVVNQDGTTSRIQISVFDLERGNDGAALIWLQTNSDTQVLLAEVPEGMQVQDAIELTADYDGNVGRIGTLGKVQARSVTSYLYCMTGHYSFRKSLVGEGLSLLQVSLLASSTLGCAVSASVFGPFSFAVFFPCMLTHAGVVFLIAHPYCYRWL